jgi:hypothetical protein
MHAERPVECQAGDQALAMGAWAEACQAYESALAVRERAESLEGLGVAAWWLDLTDTVFDTRERAYRLFLERGAPRNAARVGVAQAARRDPPATSIWSCSARA